MVDKMDLKRLVNDLMAENRSLKARCDHLFNEGLRVDEIVSQARGYLIRNVLEPLSPGIEPAPTLIEVCTQVDHLTAALRDKIEDVGAEVGAEPWHPEKGKVYQAFGE